MNKKIKNLIGILVVAGFMLMFFASLAYFHNATYVEQTADLTSYPIEPVLADVMGIVALVGTLLFSLLYSMLLKHCTCGRI